MEKYIFLKPKFMTAIWGDGSLIRKYKLEELVPAEMNIDEIACISSFSGLPGDSNEILNGEYKGLTLDKVYESDPNLFGGKENLRWEHIPVSMGIGHAVSALSVQVHPTEEYAQKHLGCHGKSECWYFVDCMENADIVMGHNAKNLNELDKYIQSNEWDKLLKRYPIHRGGFYNIQAGTLHAIQAGTTFIEVCNPCPITYRFYDYDRKDKNGNPRDLHLNEAKENLLIPYEEKIEKSIVTNYENIKETIFTDNKNFSVFRYEISGAGIIPKKKPFLGAFVIDGEGFIEETNLKAGDCFLITNNVNELNWKGNMTVLAFYG